MLLLSCFKFLTGFKDTNYIMTSIVRLVNIFPYFSRITISSVLPFTQKEDRKIFQLTYLWISILMVTLKKKIKNTCTILRSEKEALTEIYMFLQRRKNSLSYKLDRSFLVVFRPWCFIDQTPCFRLELMFSEEVQVVIMQVFPPLS